MARKREFQSCMNELVCLQIFNEGNMSEDDAEEEDLPSGAFDRYSTERLKSVEDVKNCSQATIHKVRVSLRLRPHCAG